MRMPGARPGGTPGGTPGQRRAAPLAAIAPAMAAAHRIAPDPAAPGAAIRVAVSMAVPVLGVHLTGHPSWVPYAAFGAFAAVYGRDPRRRTRVGSTVGAGVSLLAAVALGTLVSTVPDAARATVIVGSILAATVSIAADLGRWRPAGPLFQLIAFSVSALVPYAAGPGIGAALGVTAAAAAFAVLVCIPTFNRPRSDPTRATKPRAASTGRVIGSALRYLLVAGTAGALSLQFIHGHVYWAMLAAVVPLAAVATPGRLLRAAHRLVGTLLGLVVGAVILTLRPPELIAVVLIVLMQGGAELFVLRHYGLAMVLITPLALLMTHVVDPMPTGQLVVERGAQTILGVAVAVSVVLLGSIRPVWAAPAANAANAANAADRQDPRTR